MSRLDVLVEDRPRNAAEAPASSATPRTRRPGHRRWSLRHPKLPVALLTIVLFVAAWAIFAPPQLGGKVSYVVTDGVSMLPHYRAGDLVILRKEPSYHVREVAAYHNAQLGVVVMHRIIARHGNHFVFKGDNNNFADNYLPTSAQIVGAEWIHLPRLGDVVTHLRIPAVTAVLLALLWVFSIGPAPLSRRRRRRRRHHRAR
jgi:signal peptidase I